MLGAMAGWNAASATGFVDPGLLGVPWLLLAMLAVPYILAIRLHVRERRAAGLPITLRSVALMRPPRWLALSGFAVYLAFVVLLRLDPLQAGALVIAGPEVAEVRSDGTYLDEEIDKQSSIDDFPGGPCEFMFCRGPRYIYRLSPGSPYTYGFSIRNDSLLPISVVGVYANPDYVIGLGLVRDPLSGTIDPDNVRPFEPVWLLPGDGVTLVVAMKAGPCADASAEVPTPPTNEARGLELVVDMITWRRAISVYPHARITVAGEEACTD